MDVVLSEDVSLAIKAKHAPETETPRERDILRIAFARWTSCRHRPLTHGTPQGATLMGTETRHRAEVRLAMWSATA